MAGTRLVLKPPRLRRNTVRAIKGMSSPRWLLRTRLLGPLALLIAANFSLTGCNQRSPQLSHPKPVDLAPNQVPNGGVAGKLTMSHRRGAWIAINNHFADVEEQPGTMFWVGDQFWTGLLFQIGDFMQSTVGFSSNGAPVDTVAWPDLAKGEMYWVNIVSRRSEEHGSPMTLPDILDLAPPCFHYAGLGTPPPAPVRRLHRSLSPFVGIITYWQGPHGFSIDTNQSGEDYDNDFTFSFKDSFKIETYRIKCDGTVISTGTHGYGKIDRIYLVSKGGPDEGNKQDPPWTPPPNPPH